MCGRPFHGDGPSWPPSPPGREDERQSSSRRPAWAPGTRRHLRPPSHVQTRGEASECLSGRRENSQQDWKISVSMSLCMSIIYTYICVYVSIYPHLCINLGQADASWSWSTALCWRWDLFTEKLGQRSVSLSVLFVRAPMNRQIPSFFNGLPCSHLTPTPVTLHEQLLGSPFLSGLGRRLNAPEPKGTLEGSPPVPTWSPCPAPGQPDSAPNPTQTSGILRHHFRHLEPSPRGDPQARVSFPRYADFSYYSGLPTPGASPWAGRSHVLCYLILTTSLQGTHWSRGEAHGGYGLGNWTLSSTHVACTRRVHSDPGGG